MRALLALLSLTMLLKAEAAGLADQRLGPKERAIIGSVATNRVAILQKFNYAVYTGDTGSDILIASFTIPANTILPGDQFQVIVGGTMFNNSAAPRNMGAYVQIVQGTATQNIGPSGALLTNAGGTTEVAWRSEIHFGANIPGAAGQYTTPISSSAVTATPPNYARNLPNSAIGFAGMGSTILTNTSLSGGVYAGGDIQAPGAASLSRMLATRSQLVLENSQPMQINVYLLRAQASTGYTVQAGFLQGM